MSVQTEINRIKQNISDSLDTIAAYGVLIQTTDSSNELPERIAQIANALEGFVKYTQQTLTDTQKQQARTNIGAIDSSYHDSTKQNTISDLDVIRKGAALGATALQGYTETDPTVPQYLKDATNIDDLANRVSYKGTKLALIVTGVESIIEIDNPEWREVVTDNENKILMGIKQDGSYHIVKI